MVDEPRAQGTSYPAPTVARPLQVWRVDVASMSAARVAASLGVARSAVANWEPGLRTPGAERPPAR